MRTRSQARAQPGFLALLPPDVLEAIADRVPPVALVMFWSTCKRTRAAAETRMNMLLALTRPPFNLSRRYIFIECPRHLFRTLLDDCGIGDEDLKTFADAICKGALPGLHTLFLNANYIGGEGMNAFATAIGKGALPLLQYLNLGWNQIGDEGMIAFAEVIRKPGALSSLTTLRLDFNQIRNNGMKAFAEAIRNPGTLPQLHELGFAKNRFGDEGMNAFAAAINSGVLSALKEIIVDEGPLGKDHPALKTACVVRGLRLDSLRRG